MASTASVRIFPYAATTPRSARSAGKRVEKRRILQPLGLQHRQPAATARALTGRVRRLLAAAARPIRLRDDADDRWREASSASSVGTANSGVPKNTTRSGAASLYHLPARVSLRILRTIMSRLMPRRRSTNSVPSR